MGMISVVLVKHDALDYIGADKNFGRELRNVVIIGANSGGRRKTSAAARDNNGNGVFCNAADYVGTFHTHDDGVVLVGGGSAERLKYKESRYLIQALERFRRKKSKEV